jgi:hypothetical protein
MNSFKIDFSIRENKHEHGEQQTFARNLHKSMWHDHVIK